MDMGYHMGRRLIAALLFAALVGAAMPQNVAAAQCPPSSIFTEMGGAASGTAMPCDSKMLGCFTDIGCVWVVSLPARFDGAETEFRWSSIAFWSMTAARSGRSLKPDIGPPIVQA